MEIDLAKSLFFLEGMIFLMIYSNSVKKKILNKKINNIFFIFSCFAIFSAKFYKYFNYNYFMMSILFSNLTTLIAFILFHKNKKS